MSTRKKQVIIDVRDPAEFEKGHAEGSINIPLAAIEDQLAKIRTIKKDIIVVCGGGTRNVKAHDLLKQHGIDSTAGGSWKQY